MAIPWRTTAPITGPRRTARTAVRCGSHGFSRDLCRQAVRSWRVKTGPDAPNGRSRRRAHVADRRRRRSQWADSRPTDGRAGNSRNRPESGHSSLRGIASSPPEARIHRGQQRSRRAESSPPAIARGGLGPSASEPFRSRTEIPSCEGLGGPRRHAASSPSPQPGSAARSCWPPKGITPDVGATIGAP